jgi:hypothetical protein
MSVNVKIDVAEQYVRSSKRLRHSYNPPNGQNAVMQLNMGEGKSSVIVPMAATSLTNGQRLVRIVMAKPQAK